MPSENYAYLPRKIVDFEDSYSKGMIPLFAQWSYRIACHKLNKDLPTADIVPVMDLAKRMADRQNLEVGCIYVCYIKCVFYFYCTKHIYIYV